MKRILFAVPMPYGHEWGYWTRDSGLVVLALRKMGYDAWLVALGDSSTLTAGRPVLAVSREMMESEAWWRSQHPDAVILNTWSAPRYDRMRRAVLAATPHVAERLDTDGIRSARLFPKTYMVRWWGKITDRLPPRARIMAWPLAAARTGLFYLLPGLMDTRMVASMRCVPAVIAESPISAGRIRKMIKAFSGADHRVAMIPHPVNENVIQYMGTPKENRIITVGRWATAQKDFPMLCKVLKEFLKRNPDWQASIVGDGVPAANRDPGSHTEEWQRRVTYHEKLSHEELAVEYNRSKIYLMVSRYESFCIAAAEALCCGCSVVGSAHVASSFYFSEVESGTTAPERTAVAFAEALDQEVAHWEKSRRDPAAIAAAWRERVGSEAVAKATLALLEETSPVKAART